MNVSRNLARIGLVSAFVAMTATIQAATSEQNFKFVSRLEQDLLGRTPNRSEAKVYPSALSWGATRAQVVGLITASNEYRSEQIQDYFSEFLNAAARPSTVTFYLDLLQQGATSDDIKAAILGSDDYYQFAGGTAPAFLGKLFEDVLGRPIDRLSASAFENMLNQGTSRQTVAGMILHSLEADQREVSLLFEKYLHRAPQAGELANYAQLLQSGAAEELIIGVLCGSDEYFQMAIA
ncbi:MAG: hypothetical protein LAP38_10350 [Acidobacteriia bacterium]|nr:hypothetical protein [Terriglobia bacterium]